MSFYKFKVLLFLLMTIFLLNSCIISDYEDTVKIIPKDGEIIFNINLESFFKRRAIMNELDELNKDPSVRKFFDNLEELAFSIVFASSPSTGIDLEHDLLPYLNSNFTIAFYNTVHKVNSSFNRDKNPEPLNFIIVFDIKDKKGVADFLDRLHTMYPPEKGIYKEQYFFTGKNSSYFMNDHCLVFASNEDLLKSSIDCRDSNFSIINDKNFISFREKKMSDESIGFTYYNIPAISEEFNGTFHDSNWKEILSSIKYMGTSIELDRDKLKFNSFLVQSETLTDAGREFFSLPSRKLSSPDMFPVTSSAVIVLSEPGEILSKSFSLVNMLFPDKIQTFTKNFGTIAGYSIKDIISSNKEIAVSFITGDDEEENHSGNYIIAMKIEGNSPFSQISSNSIVSMFAKGEVYKDISITSLPGTGASFSMVKDFLLISMAKEPIMSVIDTSHDSGDSIENRITEQISTESVGLIYLRLDKIYNNSIESVIINEELREKLGETFENYPEIWGNINRVEDGYSSALIMPF